MTMRKPETREQISECGEKSLSVLIFLAASS